ncbi:MAG TPA: hypothetical protein VNE86_00060 [Nitrososphaerales archaeon]|nr:hypothetical protein [Nitrososphaerales archaeon]
MPIILSLHGNMMIACDNVGKHGVPRERGHEYYEFNADHAQWQHWTSLSFGQKTAIVQKLRSDEGTCVLCTIDEQLRK